MAKVKVRDWGYLENLFLSIPSFELSENRRLRKTLETEKRAMYQSRGLSPDRHIPLNDVECLSTVVESEYEVEQNQTLFLGSVRDVGFQATYNPVLRAMLLYFDRIVKLNHYYSSPGELPEIEGPFSRTPTLPPWAAMIRPMKYGEPLQVGIDELNGFKEYFAKYVAFNPRPDFLSSALDRFTSASSTMGDWDSLDSEILDYVISIEALLADREEIAQKLATRMAILLGGSADQRQDTYDFVKYMYRWRSRVVHGERSDRYRIMQTVLREGRTWPSGAITGLPWEVIGMLHWYCRLALKRIFDLTLAIRSNEQIFEEWKSIGTTKAPKKSPARHRVVGSKGTGRWMREKIIDLLDYCVVRSDLDNTLQQYYAGSRSLDDLTAEYKRTFLKPYLSVRNVLSQPYSLCSEGFDEGHAEG